MHLDALSVCPSVRCPFVRQSVTLFGGQQLWGLFHFLIFGHYEMATLSVGECALINATNCTHTIFNAPLIVEKRGDIFFSVFYAEERRAKSVEGGRWCREIRGLWPRDLLVDLHRFSARDSHTLFMCIVRGKINTKSRRKNLQPFFSQPAAPLPLPPPPPPLLGRWCKFNGSLHTFAFRQPCVARSFSANRITIKARKRWTLLRVSWSTKTFPSRYPLTIVMNTTDLNRNI